MNKTKPRNYFFYAVIIFLIVSGISTNEVNAQTKDVYKVLNIDTEIGEGKLKEVKPLFKDDWRKIVQLTLRNETRLEFHSAPEPISIQCVAGEGELIIEYEDKTKRIDLIPGTYVTLDSNVIHDLIGKPSVSIILTRFLSEKN